MTPSKPIADEALDELLQQFERQAHRAGELWERCQGKGWPATESSEFTAIRDERLPALRRNIFARAALAAAAGQVEQRERGYAERVGRHVMEIAAKAGWKQGDPEGATEVVMRRTREVAIEDAQSAPAYVAFLAAQAEPRGELTDEAIKRRMSGIEDAIMGNKMDARMVFTKMRELVNAALSAQPVQQAAGVPGFKWVPVEPTEEMLVAGDAQRHGTLTEARTSAVYRAMLAASPDGQEKA